MLILDIAIKSLVTGVLAIAAYYLLKKSSASIRHTTMLLAMLGISLLPILVSAIPKWHVPFLKLDQSVRANQTPTLSRSVINHAAARLASAGNRSASLNLEWVLFAIWLGITGILVLRIVVKLMSLSRAERRLAMSDDPRLQALVTEHCRKSGRHVLFLEGINNEPPMTWGHRRPVLVLPNDAKSWPADRLNSVVMHELAHIERGDWLASVFAQVACAISWFNPIVWVMWRQMEVESETAADDLVLSMGVAPTQYATHLVDVTRALSSGRSSTNIALAMSRPGKLDARIRAILEGKRSRRTLRGGLSLALAAAIVGIVTLLGTAAPTIVRNRLQPNAAKIAAENRDSVTNNRRSNFSKSTEKAAAADSIEVVNSEEPDAVLVDEPTSVAVAKSPSLPHHGQPNTNVPKAPLIPRPNHAAIQSGDGDFDLSSIDSELRKAGIEADEAERKAMQDIAKSGLNDPKFAQMMQKVIGTTTRAAVEVGLKSVRSGLKIAGKEVKDALHDIHALHPNLPKTHQSPNLKIDLH